MNGLKKVKKIFFEDYPEEYVIFQGLTRKQGLDLQDIVKDLPKTMDENGALEVDVASKEASEIFLKIISFVSELLPSVLVGWSMKDDNETLWTKEKVLSELDDYGVFSPIVSEAIPFFLGTDEQKKNKKK